MKYKNPCRFPIPVTSLGLIEPNQTFEHELNDEIRQLIKENKLIELEQTVEQTANQSDKEETSDYKKITSKRKFSKKNINNQPKEV